MPVQRIGVRMEVGALSDETKMGKTFTSHLVNCSTSCLTALKLNMETPKMKLPRFFFAFETGYF